MEVVWNDDTGRPAGRQRRFKVRVDGGDHVIGGTSANRSSPMVDCSQLEPPSLPATVRRIRADSVPDPRGSVGASSASTPARYSTDVRILAFAASFRSASLNRKLIELAARIAREAGAEVDLVAFGEFTMPLFDGDLEQKSGLPAGARQFTRRIEEPRP